MDDRVKIRRTRLQISTAEQPEPGARWHQHWASRFQRVYAPCIQQALLAQLKRLNEQSDGSDDAAVIHIPRLTLRLGDLPPEDTAEQALAGMTREIERQIYDQLQPGTDTQLYTHSNAEWLINGYLSYLQNGFFQNGADFGAISELETRLMASAGDSGDLLQRLRQHGIDDNQVCRMALQHSARFIHWLMASVSPARQRYLAELESQSTTEATQLMCRLFAVWIGVRQPPNSQLSAVNWRELTALLAATPVAGDITGAESTAVSPDNAFSGVSQAQLLATLAMWSKRRHGEPQANALLRQHLSSTASSDDLSPTSKQAHDPPAEASSWLVCHCGVLLLHPFLPTLFQRLGWLSSDSPERLADAHQLQALFALHYLATGQQQAEEGELVFAKFLLGMEFSEPVPHALALPPAVYSELDRLLCEVISHWSVLKNTSVAGLRETFLQRSGCLMPLDEGYRLKVELRSVDLLLQQLPWAYQLIVLPWLTKPLFVEWH
ncbi:hypothetical protein EZV61_16620 [Corallincola luteus]|uniref:Uncharacterized protein n=1 Tax=Corallincola luteus TaxID=1775177 RepID=A0ABY2AIX9_9GAMM|nr:contractile injection system tape measure protein [Corallincola luteus]TCI01888.1 hypothetical protein EZV61_16620 [Corallincola luteus]